MINEGLMTDLEISTMALEHLMIEPFIPTLVREEGDEKVISYGLSSFGYDCRLGSNFKLIQSSVPGSLAIDPKEPTQLAFTEYEAKSQFLLPPHSVVLGHSLEHFMMPDNVQGLCIGKSTYARCGVHAIVTPLEPGWYGYLTIEIANLTESFVRLHVGEGICQILFFRSRRPMITYLDRKGKYNGQKAEAVVGKV